MRKIGKVLCALGFVALLFGCDKKNNENTKSKTNAITAKNTTTRQSDLDKELEMYEWKKENNDIVITRIKETTNTNIVIPSCVTKIGNSAFSGNGVKNIYLGDNVTSIGENAFRNCSNLENIIISAKLKEVDRFAFAYDSSSSRSSNQNIYYNGTLENWCNIKFNGYAANPMTYSANFYIHDSAGAINYNGDKYQLLETIAVPSSITKIGDYQFSGLKNIDTIILPNSITNIGIKSFHWCNKGSTIKNIEFGKEVTLIKSRAFEDTTIENVYYNGSFDDWAMINFDDIDDDGEVSGMSPSPVGYRTNNFYIYDIAGMERFDGKTYRIPTSINLSNSITSINQYQFKNFKNIRNVSLPSSVKSISKSAFSNCLELRSVSNVENIESIGPNAFSYCTNLSNCIISNKTVSIGYGAFRNCEKIEQIILGNNIETIGSGAFESCSGIETIIIKSKCFTIYEGAFYLTNVVSIYFEGSNTEWNITVEDNCLGSATLYFYSETEPSTAGNYWHYVEGVPTMWS